MITQLFEQPSFIIGLASILGFIFLWFGLRKPLIQQLQPNTQLTGNQRFAQPSGTRIIESNETLLPEQQYNKTELLIKKLVEQDKIEFEGDFTAFGTQIKAKTRKNEPLTPFINDLSEKEIEAIDEDHKAKMKEHMKGLEPPEKQDKQKTKTEKEEDKPEQPPKGWKEHLKEITGEQTDGHE